MINGTLPKKIYFGLVESEGFNGALSKNPFNFIHSNVQSITIRKNGQPTPFENLELNFTNDQFLQGYLSLIHTTGRLYSDSSFDIAPFDEYPAGYTLYGCLLSPDMNQGGDVNLIKEGKIGLEIKLSTATTKSVTLICMAVYDDVIEIDKNNTVFYD